MDFIAFSFQFLWSNFFEFMNYEFDFGEITFSLWQFLLGSIIVFTIVVGIIKRVLE